MHFIILYVVMAVFTGFKASDQFNKQFPGETTPKGALKNIVMFWPWYWWDFFKGKDMAEHWWDQD